MTQASEPTVSRFPVPELKAMPEDIQARITAARQFVATLHRRPNTNKKPGMSEDEYLIAKNLQSLFQLRPDHPDVIQLKAELDALPKPECHIKRYTKAQHRCRSNAVHTYNYKVVPSRECTDGNRYVIFYTPETRRSVEFEQKCKEAGLEIKEWK